MKVLRSVGVWAVVGGLSLVLAGAAPGQTPGSGSSSGIGPGTGSVGSPSSGAGNGSGSSRLSPDGQMTIPNPVLEPDGTPSPQTEAAQAKLRNIERQKQLVEDTQKLLALANELKVDVDKSSKDTLSIDVIKKADEIEKLAHNVKEKMKGT